MLLLSHEVTRSVMTICLTVVLLLGNIKMTIECKKTFYYGSVLTLSSHFCVPQIPILSVGGDPGLCEMLGVGALINK